jgi:hypothetical protein
MKDRTKANRKQARNDASEWEIQIYDSSLKIDPADRKWYVRLTENEEDSKEDSVDAGFRRCE